MKLASIRQREHSVSNVQPQRRVLTSWEWASSKQVVSLYVTSIDKLVLVSPIGTSATCIIPMITSAELRLVRVPSLVVLKVDCVTPSALPTSSILKRSSLREAKHKVQSIPVP